MALTPEQVATMIDLIRDWYPDWENLEDPGFQELEVRYKREAMAKAQPLIGQAALAALLEQGAYAEFLERLEKTAQLANLLYLSTPATGDLRVLHQDGLDQASFCQTVYNLMYGDGSGEDRLQQYIAYLEEVGLPNYWTFPTYFLYFSHPEEEIFVKPSIMSWYLRFIQAPWAWSSKATSEGYRVIKQAATDVLDAFASYGARDMVDAQSIIWTVASAAQERVIDDEKRAEFQELFREFLIQYPSTPEGQFHIENYRNGRREAQENLIEIRAMEAAGEEITDSVLLRLLPYADSASNRAKGAWIHLAPTINGDLRKWFEAKGWIQPEDWPKTAAAILEFVEMCVADPGQLKAACGRFGSYPYTTGFQTGMLTPILNALAPDDFSLINNKSRQALNYFTEQEFKQTLQDYPKANAALLRLAKELAPLMGDADELEMRPADLFDMFSHWLVAVRKYDFREHRYWAFRADQASPTWSTCREQDCIALGWPEMGDVAPLKRTEFNARVQELTDRFGWSKQALEQLWHLVRYMKDGDQLVAHDGAGNVLGLGTAVGEYFYVEDAPFPHRILVDWYDTDQRTDPKLTLSATLEEIEAQEFKRVVVIPPQAPGMQLAAPWSDIFTDVEEANAAFDIMERMLCGFGAVETDDLRYAANVVTYGAKPSINLTIGNRRYLRFMRDDGVTKAEVALLDDEIGAYADRYIEGFKTGPGEKPLGIYRFTLAEARENPTLEDLMMRSVANAKAIFGHWQASNFRTSGNHIDRVGEAIFNRDLRMKLLGEGIVPLPSNGTAPIPNPPYPLETCAGATGFPVDRLTQWVHALQRKGQAILYGPPGTGKTYMARELARHLVGGGTGFVDLVQFHPAYTYEDFIQGIRPQSVNGTLTYPVVPGRFLEFCRKASSMDDPCVLIIDEINRANLARVFGELMYLLEYRTEMAPLAVSGEAFGIPRNVYLLGTMNTADRSIALVDHALRRRFAFLSLYPNYDVLRRYHYRIASGYPVEPLIQLLRELNSEINDPHYEVGISFFLTAALEDELELIWRMEIEPYLEEYFFDQANKAQNFAWDRVQRRLEGGN